MEMGVGLTQRVCVKRARAPTRLGRKARRGDANLNMAPKAD